MRAITRPSSSWIRSGVRPPPSAVRQLARQLVQDEVIGRRGGQRGDEALVRGELAARGHGERAPDAAARQQRQRVAFLGLQVRRPATERIGDDIVATG